MKIINNKWILIQRYITGQASPDESLRIDLWMKRDPANRRLVRELEEIWALTPNEEFEVDVEAAWYKFKALQREQIQIRNFGAPDKDPGNMIYLFRIAAIILVTFFAGIFVQQYRSATEYALSEQLTEFPVMKDLETGNGEKARLTFSDGTEVTLNASSRLRFPEEFHSSRREVYLEGEAYFKVAPNSDRTFIVHTRNTEVKVLGTEFNVRGWEEDPGVDITVRTGKVSVNSLEFDGVDLSGTILEAGYFTRVLKGQKPLPPQKMDPQNQMLWTSGGMHFESTPFEQVVRDIERTFDVKIVTSVDDLMDTRYTGTFQYAELDEVLSVIAASMDVGYKREGGTIEFIAQSPG